MGRDTSHPEHEMPSRDRDVSRRSGGDHRSQRKDHGRPRDDSASRRRSRHRSRSPHPSRHRVNRHSPDSLSPSPRRHGSRERDRRSHRDRNRSRSPRPKRRRNDDKDNHRSSHRKRTKTVPPPAQRSHAPLPPQSAAFSQSLSTNPDKPPEETESQKPNFAPTGLLAAETNSVAISPNHSTTLKYHEPPEARLPPPRDAWRLYVFKSKDLLETIELHTRSCWLFGREKAVVDVCAEHPSVSKQHAVLQFRHVEKAVKGEEGEGEWGEKKRQAGVGLYVIDLESANGTMLNGERIPERRFVEVRGGDVIGFGESKREYVVLLPPKECGR